MNLLGNRSDNGGAAARARLYRENHSDEDSSDSDSSDTSSSSSSSTGSYESLRGGGDGNHASADSDSSLSSIASHHSQHSENENSDSEAGEIHEEDNQSDHSDHNPSDQEEDLQDSDSDQDHDLNLDIDSNHSNSDFDQDLNHADTETESEHSFQLPGIASSDDGSLQNHHLGGNHSPISSVGSIVTDHSDQGSISGDVFGFRDLLADLSTRRPATPNPYIRRVINSANSDSGIGSAFPGGTPVMSAPAADRGATPRGGISFECIICLDTIDTPTSLDLSTLEGSVDDAGAARPRGGVRAARTQALRDFSKDTIVATHCGHLYHQVCLEKWFIEQGKRTCPSCRKTVPKTRLTRLFPATTDVARSDEIPEMYNNPGPSTSGGVGARVGSSASTAADVLTAAGVLRPPGQDPTLDANGDCARPACQDLKVIHNTLM